jgi:hypothetical protein
MAVKNRALCSRRSFRVQLRPFAVVLDDGREHQVHLQRGDHRVNSGRLIRHQPVAVREQDDALVQQQQLQALAELLQVDDAAAVVVEEAEEETRLCMGHGLALVWRQRLSERKVEVVHRQEPHPVPRAHHAQRVHHRVQAELLEPFLDEAVVAKTQVKQPLQQRLLPPAAAVADDKLRHARVEPS